MVVSGCAKVIGETASAIATALGDRHSRRWYCSLLWKAVKAEHQGQRALSALQHAVTRALVDVREGFGRKPGAVLAARLRSTGVLDALAVA